MEDEYTDQDEKGTEENEEDNVSEMEGDEEGGRGERGGAMSLLCLHELMHACSVNTPTKRRHVHSKAEVSDLMRSSLISRSRRRQDRNSWSTTEAWQVVQKCDANRGRSNHN